MSELAILGGEKVRKIPYPWHVTTDEEDVRAAVRVLESGVLSVYEGANTEYFMGGTEVQALEKEWATKFGVKHAVAVNSATSGLMAAVGAVGISPGDEVIVTPTTMSATATAILVYNAVPVFCDILEDTFNLDPESVERAITPRTKAIMPVHIFGHPADMDPILSLAKKHNLAVIEDAAQSPWAFYRGRLTGTIGDIGIFSLNSNKIIQCGEGGIAVTDNDELALRLRLIRNHAEAAIATGIEVQSLSNMLGWNYRMTEVEAAISRVQLTKLDSLLEQRWALVEHLTERLSDISGIITPHLEPDCTHNYYRYAIRLDPQVVPVSASVFAQALNAEGMEFAAGYEPLYLQPLYQQRTVYGVGGYPFVSDGRQSAISYDSGICPVAERMVEESISTEEVRPPLTFSDVDEIADAIAKLMAHPEDLLIAQSRLAQ